MTVSLPIVFVVGFQTVNNAEDRLLFLGGEVADVDHRLAIGIQEPVHRGAEYIRHFDYMLQLRGREPKLPGVDGASRNAETLCQFRLGYPELASQLAYSLT